MEKQQPHSLQGAPTQKGSKEETFAALALAYGFTHEVTTFLIKGPMENLEDFCYYFADEEEIDAFVIAIWKPEATTPQELEEEPEVAPVLKGDCRQLSIQISRVNGAMRITAPLHQQQNWMILLRREPSVRSNCSSGRDTGRSTQ